MQEIAAKRRWTPEWGFVIEYAKTPASEGDSGASINFNRMEIVK